MNASSVTGFVRGQLRGLCFGAVCVAGFSLVVTEAGAATAPSAVAGAQAYVNANKGKAGSRFLAGRLHGGGVHGGANPIADSLISIYAAGTSGYGSGSLVGLGYSDDNGSINAIIVAKPDQELYLVASGGFSGDSKTYNTAIGLSAPLGTLATLPSAVVVNEATTVGAVYALAPFLDSTGQTPGTSAGNLTGLTNAFSVFGNLVNVSNGTAATSLMAGASGTPPTATVNTLANVLAACVGSGSSTSSQCTSLLAAATPVGGSAPRSTLAAALDIARNEGNNVAALYALGSGGPFTPALTAVPNDWSVALVYGGGAFENGADATALAFDASGNAWVASEFSDASVNGGNGFVLSLSPTGVQGASSTDSSIIFPDAIAVDESGNVWVGNTGSVSSLDGGNGSVSAFAPTTSEFLAGSPFGGGGLFFPVDLKTDTSGNVWVLSSNENYLTELQAANSYAVVSFPVTDSTSLAPIFESMALDGSGDVFASDNNNQLLVGLSAGNPGQQITGSPFPGISGRVGSGLGVDASGNVWQTSKGAAGIIEFLKSASFVPTQFLSNDIVSPGKLAFDGAGNVWVANQDSNGLAGVVPLSSSGAALSGAAGTYVAGGAVGGLAGSVAVDPSGDVWLTIGSKVVELVGAATPVKTPAVGAPQLP